MSETRRRSSRILAAENKTPPKAQKPQDSSDDDPSGNGSDDDGEVPADDMQKGGTPCKGSAKSPEKQKQPIAVQLGGQRNGPGAAAHKKRKMIPDAEPGEDEPVHDDGNTTGAPATAGPGPSSMAAAASAKPKPAPKRGKTAPLASLHNLTLWDIITKHPASVERAAKEWVDRYCQNKLEATSELMSMIVLAGGCESGVSVEDLESGEMDDVVKRLVDTIVHEGGTEPFRDKKLRNLRSAYEGFWRVLIADLHAAGHLLDDYVCDRLANLLIGMSSTKVRGYRHAGTLTAGLLMTGWVCAQQQLAEAISTARHQEEAAQKQKKAGADKKRMIQSLQRQAEAAQSQSRQLKSLLETTFTAVFAVRFRDVGPEIRAVVVDQVGRWIGLLPATFMVDQYLKYVAWALSDRDAGVRAVAITRLLELFGGSPTVQSMAPGTRVEPPAHLPLLHGFIERFTVRFKELPYDIDEEVAVLGVQLLTRLVAVGAITDAQLPASDCYSLLIDNPPAIRRAASGLAGQLLQEDAAKLESSYAQHVKEAADVMAAAAAADTLKRGGTRRSSRSKAAPAPVAADAAVAASLLSNPEQRKKVAMLGALLGMMSLLRTGQSLTQSAAGTNARSTASTALMEPELVDDMVDALYERLPVLRSWKLIVDCMSDDLLAQLWGPTGLAHLAELLAASVKRARSGASAVEKGGINALRQGPRLRAKITDGDALMEASQLLINALPRLLRRHQADQNVVCPLIALIRDLKLELFSLSGDDAGWRALLMLVGEQLTTRGTVAELFTQCAETLTFTASSGPPALQPSVGMVLRDVCEQLAGGLATAATAVRVMDEEDLINAVEELAAGDKGADVEELLSLRMALLRAHAVLIRGGAQLATDPRVHDAVDELLAGCGSGRFLGAELTGLLAETQLVVLLNNVHQINTNPQAAAALAPGGPGPSGSNTIAPVQPSMLKLQQSRDALVAHMVALHSAAAAQNGAMLEPDEKGSTEDARCDGAGNFAVLQDMAFRVLSDVALVFGSKAWKGTAMEPVCQLALSNQVAELMWRHCSEALRREDTREDVDEEDGEEDEEGIDDDMTTGPHGVPGKRARRMAAVANKMVAVGCLGRLLAHGVFSDYHRTMATNLVAEFCNHGTEVADLIRDMCRELAASRPHGEMPEIYTQALRQSWTAVTTAGDLGEDAEHEALQRFAELAKHIASMYAGHGTSRSELLHILRVLTDDALVDAPTNLAILAWGAASFVPKLAPADGATLVSELEGRLNSGGDAAAASGAAELAHDRADPDWAPLYHYMGLLKGKASKGRVAPRVLKGASATTPKAARNRKITFVLSPRDHEDDQDRLAEAAAGESPQAEPQGRKRGRSAAAAAAAEDGAWLRKAVGGVQIPAAHVQEAEEDAEEETVKPAPRQQPNRCQVANTHDVQAADTVDNPPGEGNGHAGATGAARAGAGLRAVDVDAGPFDDLAQTQSPRTSAGTSKQWSLRAISDTGAESAGARVEQSEEGGEEEEEADGREAFGGELSDLQATTESRAKTASVDGGEVGAGEAEQDASKAHAGQEAIEDEDEGDGEGNPLVLPTEEELPSPARRTPWKCTPAPATRPVAAAAAARAAPSVSRMSGRTFSLTARSDDVGSRAIALDPSQNGYSREDGDGDDEADEMPGTSQDVDLMASESRGTGARENGVNEAEGEATAVDDSKDGEGGVDKGEGEGEENEEQVNELAPCVQRTLSTRKRRLSNADLAGEFGVEEAEDDGGSDQLLPLPSISAVEQSASMRADSTVDTQSQMEPPKRRVKRRRR